MEKRAGDLIDTVRRKKNAIHPRATVVRSKKAICPNLTRRGNKKAFGDVAQGKIGEIWPHLTVWGKKGVIRTDIVVRGSKIAIYPEVITGGKEGPTCTAATVRRHKSVIALH